MYVPSVLTVLHETRKKKTTPEGEGDLPITTRRDDGRLSHHDGAGLSQAVYPADGLLLEGKVQQLHKTQDRHRVVHREQNNEGTKERKSCNLDNKKTGRRTNCTFCHQKSCEGKAARD